MEMQIILEIANINRSSNNKQNSNADFLTKLANLVCPLD